MNNQEAIKMLTAKVKCMRREINGTDKNCNSNDCDNCKLCYAHGTIGEQQEALTIAISALEKQIPEKPIEEIEHTWGIQHRQAVCPECDCFLGNMHFLGDGKQKITYCENCGQAIDWTEWEGE